MKKERISFFIPADLSNKINEISEKSHLTLSEFSRKALINYIEYLENEKIKQELEKGYKENSDYYIKMQKEWEHADKE